MRHYYQLLLLLLLLPCVTSCDFRDILSSEAYDEVLEDENACIYILDIDWSELDEDPSGMTVMFYPSDGSLPYIRLTNEVHHYEVTLPADEYRVLVFNQSVNEFSYLEFSDLNDWENAQVQTPPFEDDGKSRIDRLYDLPSQAHASQRYAQNRGNTRAKVFNSRMQVKGLGTATSTVSPTRQSTTSTYTRAKVFNSRMQVKPVISRMTISVRVQGLSTNLLATHITPTVAAVNGALTGLATGVTLNTHKFTASSLTQELNEWTITSTDSPTGIGNVRCEFGVFGISPLVTGLSQSRGVTMMNAQTYSDTSDEDDTENILYLNFRLTNGTYVPFRFVVTDRIREQMNGDIIELTLDIGINLNTGEVDVLDNPLHLPDIGLPYGGIGINVKEWGEVEKQEIIMN